MLYPWWQQRQWEGFHSCRERGRSFTLRPCGERRVSPVTPKREGGALPAETVGRVLFLVIAETVGGALPLVAEERVGGVSFSVAAEREREETFSLSSCGERGGISPLVTGGKRGEGLYPWSNIRFCIREDINDLDTAIPATLGTCKSGWISEVARPLTNPAML